MYAACVHMGLGEDVKVTAHSSPEDYVMGQKEWDLETLKDMEMTVSATDPLYDAVLVAKEKRGTGEETLWVIKTTFVAVGVIRCQIYAMKQKPEYGNRVPIGLPRSKNLKNMQKGGNHRTTSVVKIWMLLYLSQTNWDDSVSVKVLGHCRLLQKISKTFDSYCEPLMKTWNGHHRILAV